MKKIIAFILALVSAITLCACKGNGKEKADGEQELFLTDENDAKYTIDGSVVPDDYTSEISNYIREMLPLENLFLFDGNKKR